IRTSVQLTSTHTYKIVYVTILPVSGNFLSDPHMEHGVVSSGRESTYLISRYCEVETPYLHQCNRKLIVITFFRNILCTVSLKYISFRDLTSKTS
ncbi:hypothetical protein L9F63_021204, partial [Diploptera punctata]